MILINIFVHCLTHYIDAFKVKWHKYNTIRISVMLLCLESFHMNYFNISQDIKNKRLNRFIVIISIQLIGTINNVMLNSY